MPSGFVFYEGPSQLDGSPIVAIATLRTKNRKTGDMVQTWIMRNDMRPEKAAKSGDDVAICGHCPLRPVTTGLCYVNTGQAPLAVYKAWNRGGYPVLTVEHTRLLKGRGLRMGTYGEPTAVPITAWRRLVRHAAFRTGYTHQWARFPEFRDLIMASVHSEFEACCAQVNGWRTFRTRSDDQPLLPSEVVCPASPEGDNRRTCETCGGCNGGSPTKRSFAIIGHGKRGIQKRMEVFHEHVTI